MRDIGANLLRGQRSRTILGKHLLIRCVLTYGANTYTYTTTAIKQLSHTEQHFSQRGTVLLDDTSKALHSLDLEGYKAVLSYGLITKAGAEWIATAPLWVVGQQRDSYRDRLECGFSLEGIFDRMAKHKAVATYTLESTDTQTVKTLLTAIAEGTLACWPVARFPAYTITFDSEDDLIDTFIPADGFRVSLNDSRLSKFKELMRYTDCVARIQNDGAIHIFTPTTSGTTYNASYTLIEGRDYQNFFSKRFRRRVVSPNYITYMSYPSSGDGFTGYASDASAALTDMREDETHYARVTGNDQCTNLATALLSKHQMEDEIGSAVLPFVHFGQELYDYVNIVDSRAGDSRAGNVGFMIRSYQPGQFNMSFGFGRLPLGVAALQGIQSETGLTVQNLMPLIESLYSYLEQVIDIMGGMVSIDDLNQALLDLYEDAYFRKLTVTERLRLPYGTDKYG